MRRPTIPPDEAERIKRLHEMKILGSPAEERFDRFTRLACRIFDVPIALVSLIDSDRQWFKSKQGLSEDETSRAVSICGHAINQKGLFVIPDASKDDRFADNPLVLTGPSIRFYAACPIASDGGSALGTLCIIDTKPRRLLPEDCQVLEDLGEMVSTELITREMATTDPLTGVASRRLFFALANKLFAGAARGNVPLSVLYIDLDNFKNVNDSEGHAAGDQVLTDVATALRKTLRESDVIGRVGGDEFAVLLARTSAEQAAICESRFNAALRTVNSERSGSTISCSIGVVARDPARHLTFDDLIGDADKAMYDVKMRDRRA